MALFRASYGGNMSSLRRRPGISLDAGGFGDDPGIFFDDKDDVPLLSPIHLNIFRPASLAQVVNETHFSKNEVRSIYRAFKETSPNAVINKDILREKFAELFPHGDTEHYSDLLFDTFDNDGNGTINFEEFIKALSMLTRGSIDEKLEWLYSLYDPKNKGEITWHRLLYVITAMDDLMGRKARPVYTREQKILHANNVFKKFDIGNKGKITKRDFFRVCKEDPATMESIMSLYTIFSN